MTYTKGGAMTTADFAALVWLVYLLVILLVFAMPFMALSATLSLRGIHRELQRMNGVLKPAAETTWRPAEQLPADVPAASLGHQLLK